MPKPYTLDVTSVFLPTPTSDRSAPPAGLAARVDDGRGAPAPGLAAPVDGGRSAPAVGLATPVDECCSAPAPPALDGKRRGAKGLLP